MALQHVLVPLDGSPFAEQALQYAVSLVSETGKVTLLMVIEIPVIYSMVSPSPPILPGEMEDYETHRKKRLLRSQEYLNRIANELSVSKIDCKVINAPDPAETIVETARDQQVNAIVMSTHGRRGVSRWLMGSVTQKVLHAAPCPVFVVPNRALPNPESAHTPNC